MLVRLFIQTEGICFFWEYLWYIGIIVEWTSRNVDGKNFTDIYGWGFDYAFLLQLHLPERYRSYIGSDLHRSPVSGIQVFCNESEEARLRALNNGKRLRFPIFCDKFLWYPRDQRYEEDLWWCIHRNLPQFWFL